MLTVGKPSKYAILRSYNMIPEPKWLSILVLTIVLGSCILFSLAIYKEATEIKSGEVYNKKYHPPYTSYTTSTISNGNGGTSSITTPVHHPERWTIYYRKWSDEKQKWLKGDADVYKEYWESVELGDFVNFGGIDEGQRN